MGSGDFSPYLGADTNKHISDQYTNVFFSLSPFIFFKNYFLWPDIKC